MRDLISLNNDRGLRRVFREILCLAIVTGLYVGIVWVSIEAVRALIL